MSAFDGLQESKNTNNEPEEKSPEQDLVQWVMVRVNAWRDARDSAYKALWADYYRMWRGRWSEDDRTRKSERSRLVSPALSQALEMTVAELEEATFGRDPWITTLDDAGDPDHTDIDGIAKRFIADMAKDRIPSAISHSYLNGGLWGTLAAKVHVEPQIVPEFEEFIDPETEKPRRRVVHNTRAAVKIEAIQPMDLIPDPDGRTVDEMMGIAHELKRPRSWLLKNKFGHEYAKTTTGHGQSNHDDDPNQGRGDLEATTTTDPNDVLITEYHGKVPKRLLKGIGKRSAAVDPVADFLASAEITPAAAPEITGELDGDGEMVEAIVTIFDKNHLGRAMENPFMFKDRSIVCAQFEFVPGRFWGRGVMEKGYNPQKALDAELRTRMDIMALISNPQMVADQTSLPRGFDLTIRPGKVWLTNSEPGKAIAPLTFPNMDPASFSQTSEMERMVQIGTGAMDTATPIGNNTRNETATGTSLIAGTFVKRAKRALRNITNDFVQPLIEKVLLRRMEYDPTNYPTDFNFSVIGTLGIVARELEQANLTQMLGLTEQGSATHRTIVKAIFDNTSSPFKAEMNAALLEDAKPDPAEQAMQKLQQDLAQLTLVEKQADIKATQQGSQLKEAQTLLTIAEIETELAKPGEKNEELRLKLLSIQKEFAELQAFNRQIDVSIAKILSDATRGNTNGDNSKS